MRTTLILLTSALLPSVTTLARDGIASQVGPEGPVPPSFTLPNAPGSLTRGPQIATAGRTMRVDWLLEDGAHAVASEGGIWPGKTYAFFGVGRSFDAQTIPAPGEPSPLATLFVKAYNAGAASDVVGLVSSTVAGMNGATVFGANFIARTEMGVKSPKLVALELDVEPAAGVVPSSNSMGLAINAFNSPIPGPAIQLGGVGGGTFNNGIGIGGVAASGAGLFGIAGTRMGSLVNSGAAAYAGNAPIVLSNGHAIQFSGRDGAAGARIVNDDANDLRVIGGTRGVSVRDNADTKTLAAFDPAGNLRLSGSLREEGSAPPTSAHAPCIAGQHAWDANYEYRCVAPNLWKRAALAAW